MPAVTDQIRESRYLGPDSGSSGRCLPWPSSVVSMVIPIVSTIPLFLNVAHALPHLSVITCLDFFSEFILLHTDLLLTLFLNFGIRSVLSRSKWYSLF